MGDSKKPKMGIVELVLYNMASFLASFATGYDVRISNVVPPVHPRLQAQNLMGMQTTAIDDEPQIFHNPFYKHIYMREQDLPDNIRANRMYGSETYHGPCRKIR